MRYLPWTNKTNLNSKLIWSAFFIALILIVLRYLSGHNKGLQNNSHYRSEGCAGIVSFTMPEYVGQRPEIIILRFEGRSVDTITTGFLQNDVRDKHTQKLLWDTVKIATSEVENWDWLAGKLNLVKGGELLYKLGRDNAGIDSLILALQEQNQRDEISSLLNPNPEVNEEAVTILAKLGKRDVRVVSHLLQTLKNENALIRAGAARTLWYIGDANENVMEGLATALNDPEWIVRNEAVMALGNIGKSDEEVIVGLRAALRDESSHVCIEAIRAIDKLNISGERIIDSLIDLLNEKDPPARSEAARVLGAQGKGNQRVITALLAALRDKDGYARHQAAAALAKLGKTDGQVINALSAELGDNDLNVRREAVQILGELRSCDKKLINILLASFNDDDWGVRDYGREALVKLGARNHQVVTALENALKHKDWRVRSEAADALIELGQSTAMVIDALENARIDKDATVRLQSLVMLGRLFKIDQRVIPVLAASLENEEFWSIREMILKELAYRGTMPETIVSLFEGDDLDITPSAINILGTLEENYEQISAALIRRLREDTSRVRAAAAKAIESLGVNDEGVIKVLLVALQDPAWEVRFNVIQAFGYLNKNEARNIAVLMTSLRDESMRVRAQAATVIGKLVKGDENAVSALLTALEDENSNVRAQAADALGKIGQGDKRVITALLSKLQDESWDVRSGVACALGRFGIADERVIAALTALLEEQDEAFFSIEGTMDFSKAVRSAASSALGTLLQSQSENELIHLLTHKRSGYRAAAAQALARKRFLSKAALEEIERLRFKDQRPWVRLGAWEAYELIQEKYEFEGESSAKVKKADFLFSVGEFAEAGRRYDDAFHHDSDVIQIDSVKLAYTHFQKARCAAKLKSILETIEYLERTFKCSPTLRDTLQAEMAKPENDWKILAGNWYLREVLLKTPNAPK